MKHKFIAAVKDDYIGNIAQIARKLKAKGCEIDEILELTGVITGRVNSEVDLDTLHFNGIASIEKQKVIRKIKSKKKSNDS